MRESHRYLPSQMNYQLPDLICFSHLRWNFVYQRPQHLMSRFAKIQRVFFFEEPVYSNHQFPHLDTRVEDGGIVIVTPQLPRNISRNQANKALQVLVDRFMVSSKISSFISWFYSPMFLEFTSHLRAALTIYDCMDELSHFKNAPAELKRLETQLLAEADLVFTGGHSLYAAKRLLHPNIFPAPSSIDFEHFAKARTSLETPEDQKSIPHPRIGFYGVIDERMDLELVRNLATSRPDWNILLLGPVVKIERGELPSLKNIHYLGIKSYESLPSYLAGWDVAILPFALNDSTKFISPTKIPEYLAGGCPVVSTPIQDVITPYGDEKLVEIAADTHDFENAIQRCLTMEANQRAKLRLEVDEFLKGTSWEETWNQMFELMLVTQQDLGQEQDSTEL